MNWSIDPAGQDNSASFDLAGGLMGLVSGDIVKSGDMVVTTTVLTIGIRGTAILIDTGFKVARTPDGGLTFSSSNSEGQTVVLTVSPDGTTGQVVVNNAADDTSTVLTNAGTAVVVDSAGGVTVGQVDSGTLSAQFGAVVAALQAATGSDLTGTGDDVTPEQIDDIEAAIEALLDAIENPAQDDASPD
jgi:hypothetical protein